MTVEMIKKYIFEMLDENGMYVDSSEMEEDLDLREYLIDSIQYVYFIVELETRLGRELPDEVLIYENLASINGFANMVLRFYENSECDSMNMKTK